MGTPRHRHLAAQVWPPPLMMIVFQRRDFAGQRAVICQRSVGRSSSADSVAAGRRTLAMRLPLTLYTAPSFVDEASPWWIDVEVICCYLEHVPVSRAAAVQRRSYPLEYTAEKSGNRRARWRALVNKKETSATYHIPSPV